MEKYLFSILLFLSPGLFAIGQQPCFDTSSTYYFVTKEISKAAFKKKDIDPIEKTNLKNELVDQISTTISVVSVMNTENLVRGELGEYSSYSNTESYISSSAVVNNPKWNYCSSGGKYFVQCVVSKSEFEKDLFNSLNTKAQIFQTMISNLDASLRNKNSRRVFFGLKDLKKDYYILTNGVNFISGANTISKEDKQQLVSQIADVLGNFDNLETQILSDFDNKLIELELNLSDQNYAEIHSFLTAFRFENLNSSQQVKFKEFNSNYTKSLSVYSDNLEMKIEKLIRKRDETGEVGILLGDFQKISFHADNQKKIERFGNLLERRLGLSRSTLFFGLTGSSPYKTIQSTNGSIDLSQLGDELNFEQILPVYHVGLKYFFSNPERRIGISGKYSSVANTFLKLKDVPDISNPIKNFTALQAGLILGPFEFNYGPVQSNLGIEDLKLISAKFDLFRTDNIVQKLGKVNYLNIFLTSDLLTNFQNDNYFQVGIGLNYNLVFNRTSRY
jgi:hypothetical protein